MIKTAIKHFFQWKCQNWEHKVQSDTFQPCQHSLSS
jgi:hypothetical protein